MLDGSIVEHAGDLYKKIDGRWIILELDYDDWYPDRWMEGKDFKVIREVDPLDGLDIGSIMSGPDGSEAAVYVGSGMWTLTGVSDWYPTARLLQYFGDGWKIVYKPGDNDA